MLRLSRLAAPPDSVELGEAEARRLRGRSPGSSEAQNASLRGAGRSRLPAIGGACGNDSDWLPSRPSSSGGTTFGCCALQ